MLVTSCRHVAAGCASLKGRGGHRSTAPALAAPFAALALSSVRAKRERRCGAVARPRPSCDAPHISRSPFCGSWKQQQQQQPEQAARALQLLVVVLVVVVLLIC